MALSEESLSAVFGFHSVLLNTTYLSLIIDTAARKPR